MSFDKVPVGENAAMCDVLLLDDDPLLRLTLAEALRDEGFEVCETSTGPETIGAVLGRGVVGVLVISFDHATPRGGSAVAAEVRRHVPGLPVIYMTSRPTPPGVSALDRDYMLPKPFLPSELGRIVRNVVNPAGLFDQGPMPNP